MTNFTLSPSGHIIIDAEINTVKGRFIIDTGAQHTAVDLSTANKFHLNPRSSERKMAGVNGGFEIQRATGIIQFDELRRLSVMLVFDLKQVRTSVRKYGFDIDGIIGANLLIDGGCKIDYAEKTIYIR